MVLPIILGLSIVSLLISLISIGISSYAVYIFMHNAPRNRLAKERSGIAVRWNDLLSAFLQSLSPAFFFMANNDTIIKIAETMLTTDQIVRPKWRGNIGL